MAFSFVIRSHQFTFLKCIQGPVAIKTALSRSSIFVNENRHALHIGSKVDQQDHVSTNQQFDLSFEEYQKLKRSIRTKQRIAGIPFAFCGMATSSLAMAYVYPDMFDATPENVQLIMGLDPLVFSGVSGVVAAGVGYVIGTNIFKLLWKTMNSKVARELHERDIDFLKRLDKYRFDGDSKFEDDYYGETIKSLSDYRQWVRTHTRKRETHEKHSVSQHKEM